MKFLPVLLALPFSLFSQEFPELIPYNKVGKWGYCDPNRKMFLDPVFDEAGLFEDGVAKVVLKGKPSWIDLKGLPSSPPQPKDPKRKKGYNIFMKNEKYGVSDAMKQVLIPAEYDSIGHGAMDASGDPDYSKKIFIVKSKKGYGIINKEGDAIIPVSMSMCRPFRDDYCLCKKKEKWGVLNMKGKEVVGFKFDNISYGNDGIFLCETWITKDSSAWEYVNKDGKPVGEKNYREADDFWYGLAAVKKDSAWGYINSDGKDVTAFIYEMAGPFLLDSGRFALVGSEGKYGIVNSEGTLVVPAEYDKCLGYGSGLFRMQKDGKTGFVNSSGSVVIPLQYEEAGAPKENYIAVKTGGKWGIIDTGGNSIIAPTYEGEMGVAGLSLFWVKDLNGDLQGYVSIYGTEYWGDYK